MKEKKAFIKPFIWICLTIALIVIGGLFIGNFLAPYESGYGLDAVEAFHSLPEDSVDVIIYGSSHAWKDIDTRVIRDKWGISAYNYGCNWQSINTTQLFLEDSFATQSPKVVCIDTYKVHNILCDTDMDGQIYYTRKLPSSDAKSRYLKQCFGSDIERYASYYFPIIMFHDNWDLVGEKEPIPRDPQHFVDTCGYMDSDKVVPCERPDYENFPQDVLGEDSKQVLDEMIATCKAHGAEVIFFTAPFTTPLCYDYCFGYDMAVYAAERGAKYINMFELADEIGIDWQTDFRDIDHFNDKGAAKAADYLGKYIRENYDL